MSPNYPDDYPNNYEEVILKFPCFPHDAQYSRHGHWSQQLVNLQHSHSQHLIWIAALTGWRSVTAPPPSAIVVAPVATVVLTTVAVAPVSPVAPSPAP